MKTLELLLDLFTLSAEEAYEKIKKSSKIYIKYFLIATILWVLAMPICIMLKIYTGASFVVYLGIFLALIFALASFGLGTPIGIIISMIGLRTIDPIKGSEKYFRFVGIALFIEIIVSIYIINTPMDKNAGAVPVLILAAIGTFIGSKLFGGWVSGRFYVKVVTIIMFTITISFFIPSEISQALSRRAEKIKIGIVKIIDNPSTDASEPKQKQPTVRQPNLPRTTVQPKTQTYTYPKPVERTRKDKPIVKEVKPAFPKLPVDSPKIVALPPKKSIRAKLDSARKAQDSISAILASRNQYQ
jgi:hypothetical protein